MTEPARRLLSLLGVLPDGIARTDLETLLPGLGNTAAATLRQVALGFDEAGRLRTLAPVREYVAAYHRSDHQDLRSALSHYVQVALDLGPNVGVEGGADAVKRLAPDAANISRMISGLNLFDPVVFVEAAVAFSFSCYSYFIPFSQSSYLW